MNRAELISALVEQVEAHEFALLFRNRAVAGHIGGGWAGALGLYSPNGKQPAPSDHFDWLNRMTHRVAAATAACDKVSVANEILEWGGMKTRIPDSAIGFQLLDRVVQSAAAGINVADAPMNSSFTKIAAVFCYRSNAFNTIWDSRVSTAICFRLACILQKAGMTRNHGERQFPALGFVAGVSRRVINRLDLVGMFWPNVYQKWSGHFAGAKVVLEISDELNRRQIECPEIQNDLCPGQWTPWKVNMVFFIDDIVRCPDSTSEFASQMKPKTVGVRLHGAPPIGGRSVQVGDGDGGNDGELCGHHIVNRTCGIHFEPKVIAGAQNDARSLGLPRGEHGLGDRRLLLEFFRMESDNCKISCRVRVTDPSFDQLLEIVAEAGCPCRKGGVVLSHPTVSIFVHPLDQLQRGNELAAIREFTCNPMEWYSKFLQLLPTAFALTQ